jgi:hypothetical protein
MKHTYRRLTMRFIYPNGEPATITPAQESSLVRLAYQFDVPQDETGAVTIVPEFRGDAVFLSVVSKVSGSFVFGIEPNGYAHT